MGREALPKRGCSFESCTNEGDRAGVLCAGHYSQKKRTGILVPINPNRVRKKKYEGCTVSSCDRVHYARGWCRNHYQQWNSRRTDPQMYKRPERSYTTGGYVQVYEPSHPNANGGGYVLEHIKIMAAEIGRPLLPKETVHHKNCIRDDNRPENLELWVSRHPKGARVEDLVTFSVQVLETYAPHLLVSGKTTLKEATTS